MDPLRNHTSEIGNEVLYQVTTMSIIVMGFFGNIMILAVMKHSFHVKNAIDVWVVILAVIDNLLLVFSLFPIWITSFGESHFYMEGDVFCKFGAFSLFFLLACSSWITTSMASLRSIAILRPFNFKFFTKNLVVVTVLSVIVVSSAVLCGFLLSDPHIFDYGLCLFGTSVFHLFAHDDSSKRFVWIYFFSVFVVPFSLILFSSYALIRHLRVAKKKKRVRERRKSHVVARSKGCWHACLYHVKKNSHTAVVVLICLTFFISVGPAFGVIALEMSGALREPLPHAVHVWLSDLLYFDASVKFYLYCLKQAAFRTVVKNILDDWCYYCKQRCSRCLRLKSRVSATTLKKEKERRKSRMVAADVFEASEFSISDMSIIDKWTVTNQTSEVVLDDADINKPVSMMSMIFGDTRIYQTLSKIFTSKTDLRKQSWGVDVRKQSSRVDVRKQSSGVELCNVEVITRRSKLLGDSGVAEVPTSIDVLPPPFKESLPQHGSSVDVAAFMVSGQHLPISRSSSAHDVKDSQVFQKREAFRPWTESSVDVATPAGSPSSTSTKSVDSTKNVTKGGRKKNSVPSLIL